MLHAGNLLEENWDPKLWEEAGGQSIKKLGYLSVPREMWVSEDHTNDYFMADQKTDIAFLHFTEWIHNNTGLDVPKDYRSYTIDWKQGNVGGPYPWNDLDYRYIGLDRENNEYSKSYNEELHAIGVEFYLYQEFLLQYKGKPTISDLHNIDLNYTYEKYVEPVYDPKNAMKSIFGPLTQEQKDKWKARVKAKKDAKDAKKAKAKQKKKDKEAQFLKDLQEEYPDLEEL